MNAKDYMVSVDGTLMMHKQSGEVCYTRLGPVHGDSYVNGNPHLSIEQLEKFAKENVNLILNEDGSLRSGNEISDITPEERNKIGSFPLISPEDSFDDDRVIMDVKLVAMANSRSRRAIAKIKGGMAYDGERVTDEQTGNQKIKKTIVTADQFPDPDLFKAAVGDNTSCIRGRALRWEAKEQTPEAPALDADQIKAVWKAMSANKG